jgi:hypothetical protein
MKPIFIFSLPRSGSTLLQKILSSHDSISSTGEPSLMLPVTYLLKEKGVLTDSAHRENLGGIKTLIEKQPKGNESYLKYLNEFVTKLYLGASNESSIYFLDKTPKYWMIIDEIIEIFPDAKFIFLFRNPAEILASSINTWGNNELKVHSYNDELYDSPHKLVNGYQKYKKKSILVTYRGVITSPETELKRICSYLEIEYIPSMVSTWQNQSLAGNFGDPSGINSYKNISKESLTKWKNTYSNLYRTLVLKHYLNSIPSEFFALADVSYPELMSDIKKIPLKGLGIKDFVVHTLSLIYLRLNLKFLRKKYSDIQFRKMG